VGYGTLSKAQCKAVRPYVEGRTVHDIGAGDLEIAKRIIDLGAEHIVAVDKERSPCLPSNRITRIWSTFEEFADPTPTSIISWPVTCGVPGLLRIIAGSETVIYLGKNTDGLVCGFQELWEHLSEREVLAHVPEKENTLIVYGQVQGVLHDPLPEEWAALHLEKIWSYKSLQDMEGWLIAPRMGRAARVG
jgi:hypothetical protein